MYFHLNIDSHMMDTVYIDYPQSALVNGTNKQKPAEKLETPDDS